MFCGKRGKPISSSISQNQKSFSLLKVWTWLIFAFLSTLVKSFALDSSQNIVLRLSASTNRDASCFFQNVVYSPQIGERSITKCSMVPPLSNEAPPIEKPCFWKAEAVGSKWKERINLRDLQVGQKLTGHVVQELLEGKTGPKLFIECGVGRTNSKGEWSIVNGMLRLGRSKISVAKKRAARLRKKDEIEVYVSRVQIGCGRLEVCSSLDEVDKYRGDPKIPISAIKAGQEVTGVVTRLLPFGAIVDIGANRDGLLHIKKVADLYGKYIDKEKGLAEAGLERGAKVRLQVESNEDKRLFLDFTCDVKDEAEKDLAEASSSKSKNAPNQKAATENAIDMSTEELAEWAAYASQEGTIADSDDSANQVDPDDGNEDDSEDDYDDYDEERDIEDSLGLGFY